MLVGGRQRTSNKQVRKTLTTTNHSLFFMMFTNELKLSQNSETLCHESKFKSSPGKGQW